MKTWIMDQLHRDEHTTAELELLAHTCNPAPGNVAESLRELERSGLIHLIDNHWHKVPNRPQPGRLF